MRLGVHVSIEGGLCEALKRAKALRCTTMQIFSRSPRNWRGLSFSSSDIREFKAKRACLKISPLIVHIPYLVNLSSPEERIYKMSIAAFIQDIKTADQIGADYFVTHLGSHKGRGEAYGIKRFSEGLNKVLEKTRPKLIVLLEATAGSGDGLGYKFEHLRDIIKGIRMKNKVGVCLDTAHIFAAGYDISTKDGLNTTLQKFDEIVGLNRLKLIHLNDSKASLGLRVDRHDHIGKGKIGLAGIRRILRHPKLKDMTYILETPKDSMSADKKNLAIVRKLTLW